MRITCEAIHKAYGRQQVLDGIDWKIPSGTTWGLLGESGAGKTTLLRLIAGLEQPESGKIAFTDRAGSRIDPPRVGMVFQDLGLWPHLTVDQHLLCVLERGTRADKSEKAKEVLREVRMPETVWDRRPAQLSGGEGQRLAIARALVFEPDLLLLDEPLAQIDTVLRQELLSVLQAAVLARSMTAIYVTHSWMETQAFSENVAVLAAGRLVQAGPYQSVYERPANALVARATGPVVELPRRFEVGLSEPVRCEGGILVRPQQVRITEPTDDNRWKVRQCCLSGSVWQLTLQRGDEEIRVPSPQPYQTGTAIGLKVLDREASFLH